jgi:ApbE superfamily uncharacterized protein (UPF0280 family)
MTRLAARLLPDGRRLHLQDGPIDLVVQAWGPPDSVALAYRAARNRAAFILNELCAELTLLRRPARPHDAPLQGTVARRMQRAVAPYADAMFITPMAAVAGAVAEEVLKALCAAAPLARAYVNNGGDIALYLAPGEALSAGLVDRPDRPSLFGRATLRAEDGVRGVATSGWRGRSHSLGIADAVTVLAETAAAADAAATVIANAVDLPGHPAVRRVPCAQVDPDSDLGEIPVTRDVGPLAEAEIRLAVSRGLARAQQLAARSLIRAAALHLQGMTALAGDGTERLDYCRIGSPV